jgi:hypothetical protein
MRLIASHNALTSSLFHAPVVLEFGLAAVVWDEPPFGRPSAFFLGCFGIGIGEGLRLREELGAGMGRGRCSIEEGEEVDEGGVAAVSARLAGE